MCLKEEESARNSKLYSLLASGRRREREWDNVEGQTYVKRKRERKRERQVKETQNWSKELWWDLVVSMYTFYTDDPSSYTAEALCFLWKNNEDEKGRERKR